MGQESDKNVLRLMLNEGEAVVEDDKCIRSNWTPKLM